MAAKIVVDFDKCESNAVCMQVAPKYFEVRDDDFLYVLQEEVDAGDEAVAREAVDRCPKQAISLTES
jgi:ferredoxin